MLEASRIGNVSLLQCPPSHAHFTASHPSKRQRMVSHAKQERQRMVPRAQQEDKPDLIESLVGRIFGKQALEDRAPGGMKRLDVPEMYAAKTDIFADPVEGDSPEIAQIRPLLARTQLEKAPLRLAYDADRDGWSTQAFHERVNTFGAGLIVMRTAGGAIVGGYNPRGWLGIGEDRDSIAAFLFTWPDGNTSSLPVKLPKVGGPSLAVVDKPESGIAFGAEGLKALVPGREREARCRLGTFYARMPDGGRTLFAPGEDPKIAKVESLKCFVAEGSGEAWELDGIVWKTSVKKE